jgi:hypothetical protein
LISVAKFDKARAAVLATRAVRDATFGELERKYGPGVSLGWTCGQERKRAEKVRERHEHAQDAMFRVLEDSSRDWRSGVPVAWVTEELTYDDAVRPLDEPLSVVPPCAYGFMKPIR